MPTVRLLRPLVIAGALGVFACDDTCPEEHVQSDMVDATCGPTAAGVVELVNGSFEARPDPLAGWTLHEAAGARVDLLPGLDGVRAGRDEHIERAVAELGR